MEHVLRYQVRRYYKWSAEEIARGRREGSYSLVWSFSDAVEAEKAAEEERAEWGSDLYEIKVVDAGGDSYIPLSSF